MKQSAAVNTDRTRITAGKRVVSRIKKIRKALEPDELEFAEYLVQAEKEITVMTATSNDARISLIFKSVEQFHAHTLPEIVEDTGLPSDAVHELVKTMLNSGQIIKRPRYTIGGSSKQILLFSVRRPCSCV